MSAGKAQMEQLQATVASAMHKHWKQFLIEGIILLILGMAAIALPPIATLAVELVVGSLLLISGIVGLITTLMARAAPGFGWSLLSSVIGVAAGAILLWWPLNGAVSLTLILTVFLTIEGVVSIMYALDHKRELSGRWGMMLASGIVDIVLGGIIITGLPGTAAWAIGLLVGINLAFGGSALIAMALHAHRGSRN
jgi:uncharacterized membrane protein HdeD (DUF308 family)